MPESQNSVSPIRIRISGRYNMYPVLLVHHDGYYALWGTLVEPWIGTVRRRDPDDPSAGYLIDKVYLNGYRVALTWANTNAAAYAIFKLNKQFILMFDMREQVSNSGLHKWFSNCALGGWKQGDYVIAGIYKIKEELVFPKFARPTEEEWRNNIHEDYVAWVVGGEEVHRVFLLEKRSQ